MASLIFYDTNHTYELDGEQIPSVSEVTRFLSREIYGDVSQFMLDRAASRGTKVHKLTEALDKYGSIECQEDVKGYVMAYVKFIKEHHPTWKYIEKTVCHPERLYAGTLDRYGVLDGANAIVDIKTSNQLKKTLYGAAQNLYRIALDEPVDRLCILHLKPDASYKLVDLPIDDAVANACLTLHQATKKKPRKRKEKSE